MDRGSVCFPYTKGTVVPCCYGCNVRKGSSDLGVFRRQIDAIRYFQRQKVYGGDDNRWINSSGPQATIRGAKERCVLKTRKFSISDEKYLGLLEKPCCYCGRTEAKGVDRRDNKKGYVKKNCFPCCSACNFMKWTFSHEEFLSGVGRLTAATLLFWARVRIRSDPDPLGWALV
eukprot:GHVU01032483.1.p1 GENE.GHVU01032483.1~~GHVU01032483.1.p1  ORF type:complete len:173 (-),score=20.10 GHVU01032483.1:69-587(-)